MAAEGDDDPERRIAEGRRHRHQSIFAAIDLAQQQSTLSWELRSATSLARLWRRNGQASKARDLLAATNDRFTEGFETHDLIAARRLIAEWS